MPRLTVRDSSPPEIPFQLPCQDCGCRTVFAATACGEDAELSFDVRKE